MRRAAMAETLTPPNRLLEKTMKLTKIVLAALAMTSVATTALAQSCDEAALGADIAARFEPMIASADGICQISRAQIQMLEYSKNAFKECLHGKTLEETIAEIDRAISVTKTTLSDVGCS